MKTPEIRKTIKAATNTKRKETVTKSAVSKKALLLKETVAVAARRVPVIRNENGYNNVMAEIEQLVEAGGGTIRSGDLLLYRNLAKAAQAYEQSIYTIDPPRTLEGLLEWKMYELKLKQKGLAKKLRVSDAKLSLVLSGKQKPDTSLLKSIHKELGIDGNILLSIV